MKKFIKTNYFALFIFGFLEIGCAHFRSTPPRSVAFVLYDAGEAKALEPVFNYLKEHHVPQKIIAIGTARNLVEKNPDFIDIQKSCEVSEKLNSKLGSEESLISYDINKITDCLNPTLVVTGMVSTFQKQLSDAMKQRGVPVWGYYDSFSEDGIKESRSFLPSLAKVLVPSLSIKKAYQKISKAPVEVVGQPTLEEWRDRASKMDARKILEELDLTKSFPVVLYAGGYGKGYAAAFKNFAVEATKLKDCIVLVSLHPKSDGMLEQKILSEVPVSGIRIVPKNISTNEVALISDLVVTYQSSVGVQAVFLGKPVVYFDTKGSTYSDLAIQNHWATQVTTPEKFIPTVREKLKEKVYNNNKDVFAAFGIPKDSAQNIGRLIENRVLE
ncbi:MAG: hypothetical protein JWQ35_2022 [Bacteriovoracaceae bacterium]|nr:hypothetical protein [Bacteriovoracaceae bacterium]